MMVFIVPVKSKAVTQDWGLYSRYVNRTINSICNQSNTNFKVIIPCHEIPETNFNNDSRVVFLSVGFPTPVLKKNAADRWIKETDKGKKIKHASDYAIKIGVSYVMMVDSDDCISNKISEFIHENSSDLISGWYVKKGYLYTEGSKYLYMNTKNFQEICGSCTIIKPELIDLMFGENSWFDHERITFENDISLLPLPFYGSVYSMVNGTNITLDYHEMKRRTKFNLFDLNSIKTLLKRLKKYRLTLLVFIKKEFSVYDV